MSPESRLGRHNVRIIPSLSPAAITAPRRLPKVPIRLIRQGRHHAPSMPIGVDAREVAFKRVAEGRPLARPRRPCIRHRGLWGRPYCGAAGDCRRSRCLFTPIHHTDPREARTRGPPPKCGGGRWLTTALSTKSLAPSEDFRIPRPISPAATRRDRLMWRGALSLSCW
jgi:hypothetical protein